MGDGTPRESPGGPLSLRRLRLIEGGDGAAESISASPPPSVMMKSRSPKRTGAPGAQVIAWVAIRDLIWNAQSPYLARQLSVFHTSTGK